MMDHYETLGVARDAGEKDIKRAFRAKSMAAHPDREGGSHEAMAAVNQAYAVLSDPERRQRYDETGEDKTGPSIEDEARSVLAQIFTQGLDADQNIVDFARHALAQADAAARQQLAQNKGKAAALQSRRDKVRTVKGEVNMVHAIIDGTLVQINATVQKLEHHLKVMELASEQLEAYESDENRIVRMAGYPGTMSTSTFAGWGQ